MSKSLAAPPSVAPPPSSRGVQVSPGVYALLDWVEYTLPPDSMAGAVVEGAPAPAWEPDGGGRYGYKLQHRYKDLVLWSGSCRGDTHMLASGRGCRTIEEEGKPWAGWRQHISWLLSLGAKFSRVDFAMDLTGGEITPNWIAAAMMERRVTSRWKASTQRRWQSLDPDEADGGGTVYMGSPTSDSMCRVYDKAREIKQKSGIITGPWTRIEWQAKRGVSQAMARRIAEEGLEGARAALGSYLEITSAGGEVDPLWRALMNSELKRPLQVMRHHGTLDDTAAWIANSVAPSLAALAIRHRDKPEWIDGLIDDGAKRLTPRHKAWLRPDNEHAALDM